MEALSKFNTVLFGPVYCDYSFNIKLTFILNNVETTPIFVCGMLLCFYNKSVESRIFTAYNEKTNPFLKERFYVKMLC